MKKLIIASHNPGKVNEFKKQTQDWPFEIFGLEEIGIKDDVEETGKTFQENALIKAKFAYKLAGLPTIADDGGFEIDFLNGEPGVKSRRWKGYPMTDQEMVDYTLEKLQGVPAEKRTARLKLVLCFISENKGPLFSEGAIESIITEKQITPIIKGYPFRSIMLIPKFNKMFTDLSGEEHRELNHRQSALNKLRLQIGI
ncbi:non-canonical purine NTP pyrophosphatase [Candidatus Kuenenbacteria bacterium]|nr:non-canonical purine NTP pyrophosphatase [Candidatus Kuenenbacteria bacterium]